MIAQGIMTKEQAAVCATYLKYETSYEGLAECDVIFEAISEDLEQKKACYSEIERCCPNVKLIGSCSSSILPDALASAASKYADRIIVTHPFFPVHMVPYFELCASAKTAPGVLDYAKKVLAALDRKPSVLKKPNPGFIGNYLQFALWAAALKLVEDGVCDIPANRKISSSSKPIMATRTGLICTSRSSAFRSSAEPISGFVHTDTVILHEFSRFFKVIFADFPLHNKSKWPANPCL